MGGAALGSQVEMKVKIVKKCCTVLCNQVQVYLYLAYQCSSFFFDGLYHMLEDSSVDTSSYLSVREQT